MRLLTTLLSLAILASLPATAQNANPLAAANEALEVSLVRQVNPGMTPAMHVFIKVAAKEYALQIPDGFRMRNDPAQGRIFFQSTDNSCWMTFRVIWSACGGTNITSAGCKEWLLSEHPGAKITAETSVTAADYSGPAFNLEWKIPGGLTQSSSVAFVPSAAGIIEFTLNSSSSEFQNAQSNFKNLMVSFRICKNGIRDIPPLSKDS